MNLAITPRRPESGFGGFTHPSGSTPADVTTSAKGHSGRYHQIGFANDQVWHLYWLHCPLGGKADGAAA